MLVPVITLLIAIQLQEIKTQKNLKYLTIFILAILAAISINKNIWQATQVLITNNQVTAPTIAFLKTDPHQFIAISHEFVGQTLEAATLGRKTFFTIDTVPKLIQFSQTLIKEKYNQFTYICYPYRPCELPKVQASNLQFQQNKQQYQIKFNNAGKFGKYDIYQGQITNLKKLN